MIVSHSLNKSKLVLGLLIFTIAIIGLGCSCSKPNDPKPVPTIELVSVSNTDILPSEIVTVVFTTANADSVLMYPGGVTVTLSDTITCPVQLFEPTTLKFVVVNSVGLDSLVVEVTMSGATAVIDSFAVDESVIVGGDSTMMHWSVSNADSVVVNNGIGKLTDSIGSMWLKPDTTTTYQATAYNVGLDQAILSVTVEIFADLEATEGIYFKGTMGSSEFDIPWGFRIRTTDNLTATKLWYHLELIEGDGTLSHDSILSGSAQPTYNFSGSLGHAHVRAKVPGVDSVDVYVRASVLNNGASWQGQFIKHDDLYAWVETYNGPPADIGIDPEQPLLYADYEDSLGVVFIVIDAGGNNQPDPTEPLLGVIVNTKFDKQLPGGVGIGSSYPDMIGSFGVFDTTYVDTSEEPFTNAFIYYSEGLTFFARLTDSIIEEIHVVDPVEPVSSLTDYLPRRYRY